MKLSKSFKIPPVNQEIKHLEFPRLTPSIFYVMNLIETNRFWFLPSMYSHYCQVFSESLKGVA